jgi:hypothetical protein
MEIPTSSPGCWDCTLYFSAQRERHSGADAGAEVQAVGTTSAQYRITVFTPGTPLRATKHKRKRLA